jgi:hypothetical protein
VKLNQNLLVELHKGYSDAINTHREDVDGMLSIADQGRYAHTELKV